MAEAIEAIVGDRPGARVGELAHHWFSATQPVNTAKAISYARQAGEAALAALAPDDAVRYFSQALQLVELAPGVDPLLGCDLRVGLGQAQRQAGVAAFRETFLHAAQRARELGATDRLVQAALANNRGWFSASGVIDIDKVAVLEAALRALADEDSPERALDARHLVHRAQLRTARATSGPGRRSQGHGPTAAMTAPHSCGCCVCSTTRSRFPPRWTSAWPMPPKPWPWPRSLGDPEALYHAGSNSQINALQAGDFELAARCLDSLRSLSERLRQPTLMWMTTFKEAGAATHGR